MSPWWDRNQSDSGDTAQEETQSRRSLYEGRAYDPVADDEEEPEKGWVPFRQFKPFGRRL